MSEKSNSSGGIGFAGLLAIAFIVLKLCNVIAWSWWWVLSPIWIPIALVIIIGLPILLYISRDRIPFFKKKNKSVKYPDKLDYSRMSPWQQRMHEMKNKKS